MIERGCPKPDAVTSGVANLPLEMYPRRDA